MFYNIQNVNSGKVLDIAGGSDKINTNIQVWDINNTEAQKFKLIPAGTSASGTHYCYIVTPNGYYLSSETVHQNKGTNVFLWHKSIFAKWFLNEYL